MSRSRNGSIEQVAVERRRLSDGRLNVFEGEILDGVSDGAEVGKWVDGKRAQIRLRMHARRQRLLLLLLLLLLLALIEGISFEGQIRAISSAAATHRIGVHRDVFIEEAVIFVAEVALLLLLLLRRQKLLMRRSSSCRTGPSSRSSDLAGARGVVDGEAQTLPVFRRLVLRDAEEQRRGVRGNSL